jgi:membrane protease subunit HflK
MAQGQDGAARPRGDVARFHAQALVLLRLGKKGGEPGNGGFQPDARSAGVGALVVALIVVVVWLFSGSFIVQEGQKAVVTTFGKYSHTVEAGWGWRWPYPIQANETIDFTQTKTVEIGGNSLSPSTGLRDSAMLTQDENIVDVRFSVQYSLKDARAFPVRERQSRRGRRAGRLPNRRCARSSAPADRLGAVRAARRADRGAVKKIQAQLDTLDAGILIANVNIESANPPEQVQAAFHDVVKAGVDRDALKNEGQAYANHVMPAAQGDAARLREDALGYKARIVNAAEGDADRFKAIYAEYQKAPGVTRDRMYIDAMKEVYSNVTKVMVDTHGGNNFIQLPLDKLTQAPAANAGARAGRTADAGTTATVTVTPLDPPPIVRSPSRATRAAVIATAAEETPP